MDNQTPRARLLRAGADLMDRAPELAALTPPAVAAAARLLDADFTACFPRPQDYPLALLQWLQDEARSAASRETDPLPHDLARLKRGIAVYLDYNLSRPALRSLMLALQATPEGLQALRVRAKGWTMLFQVEFAELGLRTPQASATLVIGMAAAIAHAEHETRQALPEMRETLYAYLGHLAR